MADAAASLLVLSDRELAGTSNWVVCLRALSKELLGRSFTVFPNGQSGQILPSTGPVFAKDNFENCDLTSL